MALAIVALIWGTTFIVVKGVLGDISTMYFLALRFALASVCLLAMFARAFGSIPLPEIWRGLRGGMAAGVFLWLGYILQTFGLKYTTAGNSGFITGLYIVLVPVIGAVLFRRRPQGREILGIAVALAGMLLMTARQWNHETGFNRGDLLTIACAVAFAFHLLVLGYYSQRERFEAVALGQIGCAALLSALSLGIERPQAHWTNGVILAIILTGVFATAVAFGLQTWGQQYTTATRTALIFALEPVFALATAALVGGEPLTTAAVCGGALILGGILTVELKPAARP